MKYKEIIKKIFFILCLLVICISNKCYSFDNCLNKFPSYWDSEKKKKSDTDTALGEYLINYVAGTSALVNNTSTDMEKWSSNDGITQTTSECILWINQYTHKKDMDYVKLSGYINDNTYNIIKNVFELYFSSKNIDAINQDIKANYNETNKTNKYDTDNSKGYYGIDEQDYLYYGVISKNYVEVIKNCKETIQEMTASAAYAKQQGIDTKVKTKFKASDGKYIDFQDDYNTKINYTKDQIKKYLDVYGIRLGETGDNRSTLISQWASLLSGKFITKDAENVINEQNDKIKEQYIKNLTGYTVDELNSQSENNNSLIKNVIAENQYYHPRRDPDSTYESTTQVDNTIEKADGFISEGSSQIDSTELQNFSNMLYNELLIIGIIIAVIVGTILGIKFMIGSVEEKADIKKLLIPYIVGCIVVFGAFGIWKLVVTILANM